MQRFLIRLFIAIVGGAVALWAGQQTVRADGPNFQTIAEWDETCTNGFQQQGGVASHSWTDDTEDIVRQTLAGEMGQQNYWKMEALKANATIIRQDSLYYRYHPEYPGFLTAQWFCQGVTPYSFDWRDSIMAFRPGDFRPDQDAAATASWGIGWFKSGVPQTDFNFQPWLDIMQNCTQTQAEIGWGYQAILGLGIYPPGVFASSSPCLPDPPYSPPALPHPLAPVYIFCWWDPSGKVDHDCDGYSDETENHISTDTFGRCWEGFESGPSWGWPSDFRSGGIPDSTDEITVTDITSFLAPVRRLGTSPGAAGYHIRWDLVPGKGLFADDINVNDLTALIAGRSGYPPMFMGQKAWAGQVCTNHPVYGA